MRVMKNDLANRSEPSVYYHDPEKDVDQESSHHLPAPEPPGLMLNNVRLNLESQRIQQTSSQAPGLSTMVKNVNVDNFKLGMTGASSSSCSAQTSSCMDREQEEEEEGRLTEQEVQDVNLYLGGSSRAKQVGKADFQDKMIRNNLKQDNLSRSQGASSNVEQEEDDPFADFESKLNVALPSRKNCDI